jgi:DNA-binding GntR family transcriptional regulator
LPKGLLSNESSGTLERAAGQLVRLVLSQQLRPGEKISIDEIALSLGVSRTPIRESLRLLETSGIVRAVPNRGFVVARLEPEETQQLYGARLCLESHLAAGACAKISKRFLSDLRALHRIYAQVLGGKGDRRRLGMLVDKAFHLRIAEQAGNAYLCDLLANVFDRLILTRPIDGFPVNRMSLAVQEHEEILAAFERHDARAAADAVVRNIDNGSVAIVEHLRMLQEFSRTHKTKETI